MHKAAVKARSEVRSKGQITLPVSIRKAVRLAEGDLVELEITGDGILMRPLRTIDAGQAWFWTQEWQAGERQASEEIRKKRLTPHKTSNAFLSHLKK